VGPLLSLGQADRRQRPQARVHAVHQPPVAERPPGLLAAVIDRLEQVRRDGHAVAGGDGPDEPEIRVAALGDRDHG
jgi:hypothetical protein